MTNICYIICLQRNDLENYHIEAITAILLHFVSLPTTFGKVLIKTNGGTVTLDEYLHEVLSGSTKEDALFSLR